MKKTSRFNPLQGGLSKVLGPREAEIMELVWELGPVTVAQVHGRLKTRRKPAYTTVMTIMARLAEKRLLHRVRSSGAHLYSAAVSREELVQRTVRDVINGLFEEFSLPARSYFVERLHHEDEEALAELERIIGERKRQGEE